MFSMYHILKICDLLKLMNLQASVMKYRLSSHLSSSLLQISRHLLFANPVSLVILSPMCLKSINQPRLNKVKKELCLKTLMKMVILSLQTILLSTLHANCYQVMTQRRHIFNFMVAHSFMMLLLVVSGMKNKSHLEL